MKKLSLLPCIMFTVLTLNSCSDKIVGTWKISSYQKGTPKDPNIRTYNIGSMEFRDNHSGEKVIKYGVLRNDVSDKASFSWSIPRENYLIISGDDSELSKIWIRVKNSSKRQLLISTDGKNEVQELELTK